MILRGPRPILLPFQKPFFLGYPGKAIIHRLKSMEVQGNETASHKRIEVFLIDDNRMVRQSLTDLINHETDITVSGEAGSGLEALEKIAVKKPDIVVVDIGLPDMNEVDLITRLNHAHPDLSILAISMHDGRIFTEEILRAGAKGYIAKNQAADDVIHAIRRIMKGGTYLSQY